jgi:alpha-tubulin suppressor-like RCC1 family protein
MSFIKQGTRIKEVSAGGKHSLYLSDEGFVYSSGSNDYGQLGYETKTNNEPCKVSIVKCI